MKKNRLIFYLIFAVFHVFVVFFAFYVESNRNDFAFLGKMLKMMPYLKYGAMLGLLFLIADVIWDAIVSRDHEREKAALTLEINNLKAKLFDLQENAKVVEKSEKTNP